MVQDAQAVLSQGDLHPLLQSRRQELIEQAQHDLRHPEQISQKSKRSCAATCCQMLLARQAPERYLALVAALASPSGEVPSELLAGGLRHPFTGDDGSGRSLTGLLLQPALMSYAKRAPGLLAWSRGRRYDNALDRHSSLLSQLIPAWGRGLLQNETTYLLNALLGPGAYRTMIVAENPAYWLYPDEGRVGTRNRVMQEVATALLTEQPVLVGLRWNDDRHRHHQLLLLRREGDSVSGLNPWGRAETLSWDLLSRALITVSLPVTD